MGLWSSVGNKNSAFGGRLLIVDAPANQVCSSTARHAASISGISAIQKYLHSSFIANEQMGNEEVGRLLKFYSLRHKNLSVTIVGSTTTMHANLAGRANSVVSVIATGSSGLLPSDGSIRKVDVEWIKTSGDWLVLKASWRP